MNFPELNRAAREIADRIEKMNANIEWLKSDTEKQFQNPSQQPSSQSSAKSQKQELTLADIKEQLKLRREEFLNEAFAELDKQFPSQLYENQTKKLPSPPPLATHEEMLEMFKKGDSTDSIFLRFQGVN